MGALTENRKRRFISDLVTVPTFSKKLKNQSNSPLFFPPPTPLSRPVHGPQRIRSFRLGLVEMGNLISGFFGSKRKDEKSWLDDCRHRVEDTDPRLGLGFVREVADGEKEVRILNKKVEDARRAVEESSEVQEVKIWEKRVPAYKRLLEETKKRDLELSRLTFELKLTEEKHSEFQFARKVKEEKPKEDLHELFSPLTDEEEDEVSHALLGGNRRELLVTHETSNLEITREVLQCLRSGAWLNDEVINLYLELLKERERREPKRFLKCHFFNTFFYKKLISGKSGYDFNAVRRWTTQRKLGYSLVECDKIFVPIHKDTHWCLAVINVKDETFQYLDSLGGMDTACLRVLARYFMDEVKDKSNKMVDTTSWNQEMVDDLPLQQNGWDCGMFMLKYTDFYSRGLNLWFSQEHMDYFRKRTAKEILRLRAE